MKSRSLHTTFLLLLGITLTTMEALLAVNFRTLSESGRIDGIYYDLEGSAGLEIKASDYVRSPFFKAPSNQPLEIYRLLPLKEGETEQQREVLHTINWPDEHGPFLVLISKRGESYAFSVAPDNFVSFPFGTFRVVNASSKRVQIKVGDTMARLKPGESEVLKPDLNKEIRGVLFQVAANVDKPRLVYSNLWSGSKTTRTLVFIIDRDHPVTPIGLKRLHESEAVLRTTGEP